MAEIGQVDLGAIQAWDIAAERDDIIRYFWHHDDVSIVESGKVYAVIGQKGEGKSAIAGWLDDVNNPRRTGRCAKLSLRDFDLQSLYELSDSKKAWQNQYSTLWSYIIITALCRIMKGDRHIDSQHLEYIRTRLRKEFSSNSIQLADILQRGGGLTFLGFGFTFGTGKSNRKSVSSFSRVVDQFIEHVCNIRIEKPYYVIFDELDEDYHDIIRDQERFDLYKGLIIGLIRAMERLSCRFEAINKPFYPVMMLRKDVYEAIQFNDKGKISYRILDISWTRGRINRLLAFRIMRSNNPNILPEEVPQFNEVWPLIFDIDDFNANGASVSRLFDYIAARTFERPRDYISFIRQAARVAVARSATKGIAIRDIAEAEQSYSEYLKQEIEDGIGGIHQDLWQTVRAVQDIGKRTFSYPVLFDAVKARTSDALAAKCHQSL